MESDVLDRVVQPTSRRERGKDERRGRIVDAACDLLREIGIEELSMKLVSARAGVSLSTVYNLFTSKQAVLAAVFDRDLLRYQALVVAAPSADPLARIFDSIEIAAALYDADPGFYRATMWRWAGGAGDPFLNVALRQPRTRFWRRMIADAVAAGHLKPGADPAVLGALVVQIFAGVLADWISGEIGVDQLRLEATLGFAGALAPFATPHDAKHLRKRIADLHRQLSHARREGDVRG
jgi:AcrR family transcriptional regulator